MPRAAPVTNATLPSSRPPSPVMCDSCPARLDHVYTEAIPRACLASVSNAAWRMAATMAALGQAPMARFTAAQLVTVATFCRA